jgi:hypothetical protein
MIASIMLSQLLEERHPHDASTHVLQGSRVTWSCGCTFWMNAVQVPAPGS